MSNSEYMMFLDVWNIHQKTLALPSPEVPLRAQYGRLTMVGLPEYR